MKKEKKEKSESIAPSQNVVTFVAATSPAKPFMNAALFADKIL
jgi:hypothetical protein